MASKENMTLYNLFFGTSPDPFPASITIRNRKIIGILTKTTREGIDLEGAWVLPGFINSHDHLDFNLFPKMVNRKYDSYHEWGKDIQENNRDMIQSILRVPEEIRTKWGIYKNLLHGFTTVVNHGRKLSINHPLINIYQGAQSIHSIGFDPKWRNRLYTPWQYFKPVAIHIGEGVNTTVKMEIDSLIRANRIRRKLIGIHAVSMDKWQARKFNSLVWCPGSNQSLFGTTADIATLKKSATIVFGSDATLTATWNLCKQLQDALLLNQLSPGEMLAALTKNAVSAWGLRKRGILAEGNYADMVFFRKDCPMQDGFPGAFSSDDILLVIGEGKVLFFDESLADRFFPDYADKSAYSTIQTGSYRKYVFGNLQKLREETLRFNPSISIPVTIL